MSPAGGNSTGFGARLLNWSRSFSNWDQVSKGRLSQHSKQLAGLGKIRRQVGLCCRSLRMRTTGLGGLKTRWTAPAPGLGSGLFSADACPGCMKAHDIALLQVACDLVTFNSSLQAAQGAQPTLSLNLINMGLIGGCSCCLAIAALHAGRDSGSGL